MPDALHVLQSNVSNSCKEYLQLLIIIIIVIIVVTMYYLKKISLTNVTAKVNDQ